MLFSSRQPRKEKQEFVLNLDFRWIKPENLIIISKEDTNSLAWYVIQPPPSVPNAAEHNPEATIAAEPEEEPPVYLFGLCGFPGVLP